MRFDFVFALFFILLLTLAGVHILASNYFLYWVFWWFDIPMHFLGGIVVALGYQSFLDKRVTTSSMWRRLPGTLIAIFVVSISWEIFEYSAGLMNLGLDLGDTISDIIFGLLGGVVGYTIVSRIRGFSSVHE